MDNLHISNGVNNILDLYPRPQLVRNSYYCLNGDWDYQICENGKKGNYQGKILVPYSPEANLSGVNKTLMPNQELWYKKKVTLPDDFIEDNLFINFGAVDQICQVFINGQYVGGHIGGYTPFSLPIKKYIDGNEFEIEIKVKDYTEQKELSRGKQSLKPGRIWYHAQSGIWQTVWLESTPQKYIQNVKITPNIENGSIDVFVSSNVNEDVQVRIENEIYTIKTNEHRQIKIDYPIYWTLENPYLYDVYFQLGEDQVKSYFGFREIKLRNIDGIPHIFLNGKEIFLNAILEQGYYKDGLYTPDSYDTIIDDIAKIKDLGFNTIRKHVKIEPYLYYYFCDRMGMLVMQDMVNGGGEYDLLVIGAPLFLDVKLKDNKYKLFKRTNAIAKKCFEDEIKDTVNNLYNFPSIIMWTIFNEAWGQYDSERLYNMVASLDPTRLIDPNSGWYDQQFGDIISHHCYFKKYRYTPDALGRATILSEYGGYSFGDKPKFSYANLDNEDKYIDKIRKTIDEQIAPFKNQGLVGAVYTQYNDIEDEKNGIVDDNRNLKIKRYNRAFKLK